MEATKSRCGTYLASEAHSQREHETLNEMASCLLTAVNQDLELRSVRRDGLQATAAAGASNNPDPQFSHMRTPGAVVDRL